VAIINKKDGKVRVKEAPMILMNQEVKSVKAKLADANLDERVTSADRRALGETFGTRKAQTAIKSYERGKIDVESMGAVRSHVADIIEEKASTFQTQSTQLPYL
jgi:DNA-directed RNA polymerase I subunit RPA49